MQAKTKSGSGIIAGVLILFCTATVQAQDVAPFAVEPGPAPELNQAIYKGVVGNLLEALPLDPEKRVQLQRTNAVVSNVTSARTLAGLLGFANPVLMIAGLVWGLWSASQIKDPETSSTESKSLQVAARRVDSLCVDSGLGEAESVTVVMH